MTVAGVKRKPWVIFLSDNRELGKPIKLLARETEGDWTMSRRRAAKFCTAEEAAAYLATIERKPATSYTVATL